MKNLLRKTSLTLAMATSLFIATPAPKAEAGILLLPTGVGVVFIVLGVVYDRLGLIILDGNTQEVVKQKLAEKYPFIDDQAALNELSQVVVNKMNEQDMSKKEITINISREEIEQILAPTGLLELEAANVEAMIEDLQ